MRATFYLTNPPVGALFWDLTICSRGPTTDCYSAPYWQPVGTPTVVEVPGATSAFLNTLWLRYSGDRDEHTSDFASVVDVVDGGHYEYDYAARTLREVEAPVPPEPEHFVANFKLADSAKAKAEAWWIRVIAPFALDGTWVIDSPWMDPDTVARVEFDVPIGTPKNAIFQVQVWVAETIPGEGKLVYDKRMELLKYPSGTMHKIGAGAFPWVWAGAAGGLALLAVLTRRR